MKFSKLFAALFGLAGTVAAVAAIALSFLNMDANAILVEQPAAAVEQMTELMEAVCRNDYAAASEQLYGNPEFGVDRDPADEVGELIWEAFTESISYELNGELYATDSGVAQNITITTLDIESVTGVLKARSTALLEKRVAETEDPDEVYDENVEYREEFVMKVLYDATVQALKEDARMVTRSVTVNMIYENDQWWILADNELLNAVSGGILK